MRWRPKQGYDGSLLHGEAVSLGMVMAFDFSAQLACAAQSALRVRQHLSGMGLPVSAAGIYRTGCARPAGWQIGWLGTWHGTRRSGMGGCGWCWCAIGAAFVAEDISGDQLDAFLAEWVKAVMTAL